LKAKVSADTGEKSNVGAIVGVIFAVVVIIIALVLAVIYFKRR
jgi:tetrahydromethanopterin S-methyltransferase subunit F